MVEIRRLHRPEDTCYLRELADVLLDCVEGGASVSFMAGLSRTEAMAFFSNAVRAAKAGDRILLAAFLDQRLVGTVQILLAMPPNQPHRAEIAKLLVHRTARNQGIAQLLMEEAEKQAREAGRTLLVLDTAAGNAERLYTRLGWVKAGVIPGYALLPNGELADTTIFWKMIGTC